VHTSDLRGHQAVVDWLGEDVLTLADLWPSHTNAVIVGLNPAPPSVAAGHYYQGRVGQRQLRRLATAGVFESPAGTYFEQSALASGVGFTDLVKRPTAGEDGVKAEELRVGRTLLLAALKRRAVPLVLCVFRHPAEALLQRATVPGFQDVRTSWGARVFRLPSPFASHEEVDAVMQRLVWD
jgi:double-stranded uracil-DNA glycosylase